MKLALAQMKMAKEMERNLQKTLRLIREAAVQGADLIVFPEIQNWSNITSIQQKGDSIIAIDESNVIHVSKQNPNA